MSRLPVHTLEAPHASPPSQTGRNPGAECEILSLFKQSWPACGVSYFTHFLLAVFNSQVPDWPSRQGRPGRDHAAALGWPALSPSPAAFLSLREIRGWEENFQLEILKSACDSPHPVHSPPKNGVALGRPSGGLTATSRARDTARTRRPLDLSLTCQQQKLPVFLFTCSFIKH